MASLENVEFYTYANGRMGWAVSAPSVEGAIQLAAAASEYVDGWNEEQKKGVADED